MAGRPAVRDRQWDRARRERPCLVRASRGFLYPATALNPLNRNAALGIHEFLVVGELRRPVSQARVGEIGRLTMRVADRLQKSLAAATRELVRDGLGDKATAVPLDAINFLEKIGGQGDGDTFGARHENSMTESMIILNGQLLHDISTTQSPWPSPYRPKRTMWPVQ